MAIKRLSIRIDEEMLNKLHMVADYEGRSANAQILILIRDCFQAYEKEHGKIDESGCHDIWHSQIYIYYIWQAQIYQPPIHI